VVLFEALTWQVHRDAMDRRYEGQPIPHVPLLAWVVDTRRAYAVAKASALRPLDAAEETLRQIQETAAVTRKPRRQVPAVASQPDHLAIAAPKVAKKPASRDRVLDFKIENPDASQAEIASALQVSAATVSRALNGVRTAEAI
jgi:hypothetical protein